MGVPSRSGDPREHNWDRLPPKAIGISTRAAQVYPAPGALPAHFQPQWPPPRAQLGSPPLPPTGAEPRPTPPGFTPPLPHSQRVSSCSGDPREHNCYRPPHPPDRNPDPRRPGSPLARCRRVAHFHQGLPVSPVPTPGSRRGSRTSLLPPGQTQGQYIHPTETIQAVYDLGIKRGLQKGKMS